jgi:RimJ/RimL family protein N-acetyltransferase
MLSPVVMISLSRDRTLEVRPAEPGDGTGLRALYDELGDEDRYRRFFSVFEADRELVTRMATAAERGGAELVAVVTPPGRIVGEAGFSRLDGGDGELAMVVARSWRGWLGPFLLDALLRHAAAMGVPNLVADVLATNRPMVTMLCRRGAARVVQDDWSVLRLVIGTTGTTPTWPGAAGHPRVLVEVAGGHWHAGAELRAAGFSVLACSGPAGTPTRCPVLRGERCPLVDGADVVVARPHDDATWQCLLDGHARVHPDARLVVESGNEPDILERVRRRMQDQRPPTSRPSSEAGTARGERGSQQT